jgi:hypothetical protein
MDAFMKRFTIDVKQRAKTSSSVTPQPVLLKFAHPIIDKDMNEGGKA